MNVKFIRKLKVNDFENERFTLNREYNVIADYRNRQSGQVVPDNGLVIKTDKNEEEMIFLSDGFEISNTEKEDTFIFNYSK